jgi:hypothetical protein
MENFIDHRAVERLGLKTKKMEIPIRLTNVDGTGNQDGCLTKYCQLTIQSGRKRKRIKLYATNLGKDRIIFGFPWLRTFNPIVDWVEGKVQMPYQKAWEANKVTIATEWATKTIKPTEGIPEEYQRHAVVFDEEAAQRFPPEREEDHEIKLKDDAPSTLNCHIYQLSPEQDRELDKFLQEHLDKGYIQESKSPYASPFFFVGKKDGKMRPVQDYRILNKHTVRDNYPLPLIKTILEQLEGKTLYTKFDIRWGYNNIRIKKGDEWKAAFKTPKGLFEPKVMYFGLTNSPATFQRAMNRMFREMKMRYPTELFVYMDDILIATTNDTTRHRRIVHEVLDKLEEESFFLKPHKCEFEKTKVDYLGVVIDGDQVRVDPTKVEGLKEWPRTLGTVKQVRSTLGILGYQRPFIPGFAKIAKPLTNLLKKGTTFNWTTECAKAVDKLISMVSSNPVLARPNPTLPFTLEVDASAYATGAILYQKHEETKRLRPVGYHSQTFNEAERNYDIHDREFLAVIRGLEVWRHLLVGSPHPVTVLTDHANLQYYRQPQKINRRVARYLTKLADYDIILKHQPGVTNKADHLSRRPDYDRGDDDNNDVTALPDRLFVNTINFTNFQEEVKQSQEDQIHTLKRWEAAHKIRQTSTGWYKDNQLVVVEDNDLRRGVISLNHTSNTAGHPGIAKTYTLTARNYWWPGMKNSVIKYIQGCAICQSRKNVTTRPKPPLFPITTNPKAQPFEVIALDFITKLPPSEGYDTILTITDHDCSKGAIFIPCNETIDAMGVAELYGKHVFPHYGTPQRVISDRDPRFTATAMKELCKSLGIQQNISTAYHPQTDGQSERTNQWLEQYLRIFGNGAQTDWAQWLPLA